MIRKFRKKPVVIEALQWNGNNIEEIELFVGEKLKRQMNLMTKKFEVLIIPTLESPHEAMVGDWIIKGVAGEFYPCKPEIFKQTYKEEE